MTDSRTYLLRLSWPNSKLSANAREHWGSVSRAKAAYRAEGAGEARVRGLHQQPDPDAVLEFHFYPPDRRKRDAHNLPHMMKSAIDGIADAMGVDDNRFQCNFQPVLEKPIKGGGVLVQVKVVT